MSFLKKAFGKKAIQAPTQTPPLAASDPPIQSGQAPLAPFSPLLSKQPIEGAGDTSQCIAGRYEVIKTLAGGMGQVHLCLDTVGDRPVALKTVRPEFLPDSDAKQQFLNEGTTWVRLGSHPHVVEAYGVELVEGVREVYLILEWVAQGEDRQDASLRSWIVPGHPLPITQGLLFALHIARGMKHATSIIPGLVHRDLKPENALVGSDGNLRVTDFGLAALGAHSVAIRAEAASVKLNRMQATNWGVCGTPWYMAPEQWEAGQSLDLRTDIYSFGCILYEMVTGMPAAPGSDIQSVMNAHRSGRLRSIPATLPEAVQVLLRKCLLVRPADRYHSWAVVEEATARAYTMVAGRQAPKTDARGKSEQDLMRIGWAWHNLGGAYLDLGKPHIALSHMERALQIAEEHNDSRLEIGALNGLAIAYRKIGEVERSIELLSRLSVTLDDADAPESLLNAPRILMNLGSALRARGDQQGAIPVFEQALARSRQLGDVVVEAGALNSLGNAYRSLGEYERAMPRFEESLSLFRMLGHRADEGLVLNNLGIVYKRLDDPRKAISFYEQALAIAQELGDLPLKGKVLGNLGNALTDMKQSTQAIAVLEEALTIARETGDRQAESLTHRNLGVTYMTLERFQEAIDHHKRALVISETISDRFGVDQARQGLGLAYHDLGVILMRQNRDQEAKMAFNEAFEFAPNLASQIKDSIATLHRKTAMSLANRGLLDESIRELRAGLQIAPQNLDLQLYLAFVCTGTARWADGLSACRAALILDPRNQMALTLLGDAYCGQGQLDLAFRYYQQTLQLNPNYGAAHSGLAVVYARNGRVLDAKREAQLAQRSGYNPPDDLLEWLRLH
jgi:tetratricopeptide (TPR) repeat protein